MKSMITTIVPKSDQLNADDLIGGIKKIIKITGVNIAMGEQPVSIHYEGDNGKPWKPCKSMRRVLVHAWGDNPDSYIGRYVELYTDIKVKFGGHEVGGLRISRMSHISDDMTIALTATRAKKVPFKVSVLNVGDEQKIDIDALKEKGIEEANKGIEPLRKWWTSISASDKKAIGGAEFINELKEIAKSNEDN